MDIAFVPALVVVISFLTVLLRRHTPETALAVSLAAGLLCLTATVFWIRPVIEHVKTWASAAQVPGEYVAVLCKGAGVCLLTQLAADTCRDAGEHALAGRAETAGKAMLLVLALPLLRQIGDTVFSLLGQEV